MSNFAPLSSCDVENLESLALFRNLISSARRMLESRDMHALANQFRTIRFNFGLFKTFFESIRINVPDFTSESGFEHTVVTLFQASFFESHIMAVRRLIDSPEYVPKRRVYSIPTLLSVIEDNIDIFTRENYVCYDGLRFEENELPSEALKSIWSDRQLQFDILSERKDRKRSDKLSIKVVSGLKKKIEKLEKVRYYANKYYAHASDPTNRDTSTSRNNITLSEMEEHLNIIQNTLIGCGKLVNTFLVLELTYYPGNLIENWDRGFITNETIIPVLNYWDDLRARIRKDLAVSREIGQRNWE